MLPRAQRLRADRDYQRLFRRGQTIRGRLLSIRFSPSTQPEHRLGVVVSTKVSKRATVRNLIKRRLRHAALTAPLPSPRLDLAIIAQSPSASATFADLRQELHQLIRSTLNHAPSRRRPH